MLERADAKRARGAGGKRRITLRGRVIVSDRDPVAIARELRAASKLGEAERKLNG